jgi:hypothetical protein
MAYSEFSLADLRTKFHLQISEDADLFGQVPSVNLPLSLKILLERYLPLALKLTTEKSRSELLIAPFLVELKLEHADRLSFFSGVAFDVDHTEGLTGRCDYILSRSPSQLELQAPVCVLVEAKSENIIGGVAQCLAEMVAAQRFNTHHGQMLGPVYGVVSTGLLWRFLQLSGTDAAVDRVEYPIQQPDRIYSVLQAISLGTLHR